jgi:hypothetical protein
MKDIVPNASKQVRAILARSACRALVLLLFAMAVYPPTVNGSSSEELISSSSDEFQVGYVSCELYEADWCHNEAHDFDGTWAVCDQEAKTTVSGSITFRVRVKFDDRSDFPFYYDGTFLAKAYIYRLREGGNPYNPNDYVWWNELAELWRSSGDQTKYYWMETTDSLDPSEDFVYYRIKVRGKIDDDWGPSKWTEPYVQVRNRLAEKHQTLSITTYPTSTVLWGDTIAIGGVVGTEEGGANVQDIKVTVTIDLPAQNDREMKGYDWTDASGSWIVYFDITARNGRVGTAYVHAQDSQKESDDWVYKNSPGDDTSFNIMKPAGGVPRFEIDTWNWSTFYVRWPSKVARLVAVISSYDGYTGTIDLSLVNPPPYATYTINPSQVTFSIPNTYMLAIITIFPNELTPKGEYDVIIRGSGSQFDRRFTAIVDLEGVGGILVPVDKFGLLAPYIGLASTILIATVATTICTKRVKRRKEKQ